MKVLAFSPPREGIAGRLVRETMFQERSTLAVSAACLVANAARDVLASAFGCAVEVQLFEPVIPSQRGWRAIEHEAQIYAVTGLRADVSIVLRQQDAAGIARATFGEFRALPGALSTVEECVLDRIAVSLAAVMPSLSGRSGAVTAQRCDRLGLCTTYFELQIVRPIEARIGFALARDPRAEPQATLPAEALETVEVELKVTFLPTVLTARDVAELEPGDIVPMTSAAGTAVEVHLAGRTLARGECGVAGGRYALRIVE